MSRKTASSEVSADRFNTTHGRGNCSAAAYASFLVSRAYLIKTISVQESTRSVKTPTVKLRHSYTVI